MFCSLCFFLLSVLSWWSVRLVLCFLSFFLWSRVCPLLSPRGAFRLRCLGLHCPRVHLVVVDLPVVPCRVVRCALVTSEGLDVAGRRCHRLARKNTEGRFATSERPNCHVGPKRLDFERFRALAQAVAMSRGSYNCLQMPTPRRRQSRARCNRRPPQDTSVTAHCYGAAHVCSGALCRFGRVLAPSCRSGF